MTLMNLNFSNKGRCPLPLLASVAWAMLLGVTLLCVTLLCGCDGGDSEASKKAVDSSVVLPASGSNKVAMPLPWNFRPYRVKVWLLTDAGPRWTERVVGDICRNISQELTLIEPTAWRIEAEKVPQEWHELLSHWRLDMQELPEALYDSLLGNDKLVLIRLEDVGAGFEYELNEIDVNGWSLGPVYTGEAAELHPLPGLLAETVCQAFRPIVMVTHTAEDIVTARVRAHGLMFRAILDENQEEDFIPDTSSPCWIDSGEIFEPILRQANRQRKFEMGEIESFDFTLLVQQGSIDDQYVRAKIVSVSRVEVALGRRKGRNTERIGIVVRTPPASTKIRLYTKRGPNTKNLQDFPLNGYQIYSRSIFGTEDSFEYLGKTDWDGMIEIEPGDERVRLLLVKNGERNLARLPVMPGYKPVMEKLLPDDEERILAEGVVSGLKSEALDLWARREVMSARIRMSLADGEFAMAERYYNIYRELMGVNQWNDMLANYERRLTSGERRQQEKITKMFSDLKQFASKEFKLASDTEIQQMMLDARRQRTGGGSQ